MDRPTSLVTDGRHSDDLLQDQKKNNKNGHKLQG